MFLRRRKALYDEFQCAPDQLLSAARTCVKAQVSAAGGQFPLPWRLCIRLCPRCRLLSKLHACVTECFALRRCSVGDRTLRQDLESECNEVLIRGNLRVVQVISSPAFFFEGCFEEDMT